MPGEVALIAQEREEEEDEAETSISAVAGPEVMDRAMVGLGGDLLNILNKGSVVELWHENRSVPQELRPRRRGGSSQNSYTHDNTDNTPSTALPTYSLSRKEKEAPAPEDSPCCSADMQAWNAI